MARFKIYFGGRVNKTHLIVCFMKKEENERWRLCLGKRVEGR